MKVIKMNIEVGKVSGNERAGPVIACYLGHFTRLLFFIDVDFSV